MNNTTTPKIKWVKLDPDESYYESADKRFELNPLYLGRVRPQGWEVIDRQTGERRRIYWPLRDAKEAAQEMLRNSLK